MQPIKGVRRLGRIIAESFRTASPADVETVVGGPEGDDVPTVDEIVNAAEKHEGGREEYNEGARIKRAARKILDRVPSGVYGTWAVSWVQSSRREWDRDAIAAFYAKHGEEIPTKAASPQIKLTRVVSEPGAPEPEAAPVTLAQAEPMKGGGDTAPELVDTIFSAAKPSGLAA